MAVRGLVPVMLLLVACSARVRPVAPMCESDQQCDPGDFCVEGGCVSSDAGVPDAGPGPDAGPTPDTGSMTLAPASISVAGQVGRTPPAAQADLRNGTASLQTWSASCDGGAAIAPAQGELPPGAAQPLTLQLPLPVAAGTQGFDCTVARLPLHATLTAASQPGVGYDGGSVDLLDFAVTGDTRPEICDDIPHYPAETIHAEALQMGALGVQFAVDLGDHMNSCLNLAQSARTQMQKYVDAIAAFRAPWFMTMGNHECGTNIDCSGSNWTTDHNFQTYSDALKAVSHKDLPYYSFDVDTRLGMARFVFLADNYAAAQWAESVLAEADAKAAMTFVMKHHPMTGSRQGPGWSHDVVLRHRHSLILTAHDHTYSHDSERSVICGLGGASSSHTGFCRVQQKADGRLVFTQYDLSGNPGDTWSVTP